MPATAISNFTVGPYNSATPSWSHTAEAGKRIYVIVTYLTYAGEGVVGVTIDGTPMVEQAASEEAQAQFHTVQVFSGATESSISGAVTITVNTPMFRVASFNISDGPLDGCVTGLYTAMSGVTSRYFYGFGYDTNDYILSWFEVFNPQVSTAVYTVTNGTQLHSQIRFAVGGKQADGGETEIAFDSDGDTAASEQFGFILTIPNASQSISGGMYQPWMGRADIGNGPAELPLPCADFEVSTANLPNQKSTYCSIPCTVRNLRIDLKTAPGGVATRTFRVYKNGLPTSLFVTISGANTTATLTGVDIGGYRWSVFSIRHISTGGPAAAQVTYCMECETGEDSLSLFGPRRWGSNNRAPNLAASGKVNPFGPLSIGGSDWTSARVNEGRIGADGDFVGVLMSYIEVEIGQSKYDSYVWLSTDGGVTYVKQDGSGGTTNTYRQLTRPNGVTQPGKSFWWVEFNLPVHVGDMAYLELTGTDNTGSGLHASFMLVNAVFRATTNGEWFIDGETTDASQVYYSPDQHRDSNGSAVESTVTFIFGPMSSAQSIPGINWGVQVAPGLGQTRTLTFRTNSVVGITSPITGTAIEADDGPTVPIFNGDTMSVRPGEALGGAANWVTMWWTLRGFGAPVPEPGVLVVVKEITGPADFVTTFDIDVGGGLSPSSLSLHDGESQTYDPVTPGSGYSVDEPSPPAAYVLVGITVSNGSPASNITVGEGELVTVTVTNTLFCPGEVTAPRNDGLPYEPPSVDPCEGTGTRGAARIGA